MRRLPMAAGLLAALLLLATLLARPAPSLSQPLADVTPTVEPTPAAHNLFFPSVAQRARAWCEPVEARVLSPNPGSEDGLSRIDGIGADTMWAVASSLVRTDPQSYFLFYLLRYENGEWNVDPSFPFTQPTIAIRDVAVVGPRDVWVVGKLGGYFEGETFTAHWDGAAWTRVPTPAVGTQNGELWAVAATATNDVWAVGAADWKPLALHWDGRAWQHVPIAFATEGILYEVSIASPSNIWASGAIGADHIGLHWDGVAWSDAPTPAFIATPPISYGSSTVTASGDHAALAYYRYGSDWPRLYALKWDGWNWWPTNDIPAIEPDPLIHLEAADKIWLVPKLPVNQGSTVRFWDGATWTTATLPDGVYNVQIADTYTLDRQNAWLVGYSSDGTLVLHWDGQRLTHVPSPSLFPRNNWLDSVEAVTDADVWAVGSAILHGNGNAWSAINDATMNRATGFYGVAHSQDGDTWVVGEAASRNGYTAAAIWRRQDDAWSLSHGGEEFTGAFSRLEDIVVLDNGEAWAVGWVAGSGVSGALPAPWALVLRRQAEQWVQLPSIGGLPGSNRLMAIDGSSPANLWAVGFAGRDIGTTAEPRPRTPILMRWGDAGWQIFTPALRAQDVALYDVAAVGAAQAWAVGEADGAPLALRFDGATWQRLPQPFPGARGALKGVSVAPDGTVWVVGEQVDSVSRRPLLGRWMGTHWVVQPAWATWATVGDRALADVAISPQGTVWAVGDILGGRARETYTARLSVACP